MFFLFVNPVLILKKVDKSLLLFTLLFTGYDKLFVKMLKLKNTRIVSGQNLIKYFIWRSLFPMEYFQSMKGIP